jgi:hypothetical protein
MLTIIYYIKKVYSKKNQSIPSNIFLLSRPGDLMFFYSKIFENHDMEIKNNTLLNNYIKAKKTKNAMNRLAYIYKLKKAKKSVYYDLYFNDLNIIKSNQKVELYCNNTIYYFRISDIINIWNECLTKCENMFCTPIKIKNPYTNIEFSDHNLYNLYLSLLYSNFHIPKWITLFFEAEFDLSKFNYDNYPILKEIALNDFMKNGTIYEKYENVINMMHEYREYLNYIVIRTPFTFREKTKIVKRLSPYLKNYLYGEYCCHPLKKKRCKNLAKRGLRRYFEENHDISFYREPPLTIPRLEEGTLSSRISRILARSRGELNEPIVPPLNLSSSNNNSSSSLLLRRSIRSDTIPILPSINVNNNNTIQPSTSNTQSTISNTETRNTRDNRVNTHRNGSIFNINLNNRSNTRDPFTPSFTLTRTPSNASINSRNTTSNINMRMFR